MKSFASPFFNHFSLSLNRKKLVVISHNKKNENATAANLLHIKIGNLECCESRHYKNEAREIDFLCRRELDAMLIASAKILERRQSILTIQLLWASAPLLVTFVKLIST